MKVYEAIATALVAEGCGPVFGLMGDGNLSFWGALGCNLNATIYTARNEAGAVAMADGYFRGTGRTGVATISLGPALTQCGTSFVAASRNRSAIVVMTGEQAAHDKNPIQLIDQRRFIEACEAHYRVASSPENLASEIAEAFYLARVDRRPVVFATPMNLQYELVAPGWHYHPSTHFYPPEPAAASEAALEKLLAALVAAERPVIVAGRGAKSSGAKDEIVRLADRTGAILSTSLQAKGLFGGHEYDIGISGSYGCHAVELVFAQADFVLGVGAELGQYTTDGGAHFPHAKFARIDNAPPPATLAIAPGLYIQGDARKTLSALNAELEARQVRKIGLRTAAVKALLEATPAADPAATDGLDPRKLMRTLSSCLPRHALITCGIAHFAGFPAAHLALPEDAEMQFSLSFGAVGQTLPIAIGIGVSHPHRPHIVIEGDGSLFMNLQELETVVRHNIQMVLIVFNDSGLGAEVHKLRKGGFDPGLAQWRSPEFVKLAQALGGDGILLTNEDEIGDAVARGLNVGGLFLIDARVSPTTRSDAYQRTHFGIKNKAPRLHPSKPSPRYEKT